MVVVIHNEIGARIFFLLKNEKTKQLDTSACDNQILIKNTETRKHGDQSLLKPTNILKHFSVIFTCENLHSKM